MTDLFFHICISGSLIFLYKKYAELFFMPKEETKRYLLPCWIVFGVIVCAVYGNVYQLTLKVVVYILGLILILQLYEGNGVQKVLTAALIYEISMLTDAVIVHLFINYQQEKDIPYSIACGCIVFFALIYIPLRQKKSAGQMVELPVHYWIMLCGVPVLSAATYLYLDIVPSGSVVRDKMLVLSASLLCMNILVLQCYFWLIEYYRERLKKQQYEQILESYAYQDSVMKESQERIRALRHDLKHHLQKLSAMAQKEGNQKLYRYIGDMEQFMLNPKEQVSSGNRGVDGILNYLLQDIKQTLKQTDVQIRIPENMEEGHEFKLCVILGNLVDNAVREAKKSSEKYLKIDMYTRTGILFLFIENSHNGTLIPEKDGFRTTQEEEDIHGIGLKNVKKMIEECDGDITCQYDEKRFQTKVLLYLERL